MSSLFLVLIKAKNCQEKEKKERVSGAFMVAPKLTLEVLSGAAYLLCKMDATISNNRAFVITPFVSHFPSSRK